MIHSIVSEEQLRAVSMCAEKKQKTQKVLIQVQLSKEESKQGMDPQQVYEKWSDWRTLSHVQICGLMTFPPFAKDPEDSRPAFSQLKTLLKELQSLSPEFPF